ncbi:unnamed protein product [Oikopleura dioica]|uniref:Uncharacterized protein n=1 Tax=Oikopleura dioica TaxID=34765 RepID=E4XJ62_OIKDI|nr:unnamed protein product [Oikopleura dioica]
MRQADKEELAKGQFEPKHYAILAFVAVLMLYLYRDILTGDF